MKIQKLVAAIVGIACIATASLSALEVDEDEIKRAGDAGTIQFENYSGPHTVIETVNAITEIGRGLGRQVSSRVETEGSFGLNGKYSVIHAVDPNETGKFDADILVIGSNATVDHIRNLRRIIAGYLMAAYNYNARDAATVATFVTVYNAVYRGQLNVFQERYKSVVTRNLTADKCGLSTKWNEWPGKSQIVIPLHDLKGGISTVDTSVISDRNVVDSMREDDDKGIDPRKEMVDIKEREAEQANAKAEAATDAADEERRKLEEQQRLQKQAEEDARKAAEEAQKKADEAKKAEEDAKKAAEEANKKAQQAAASGDQADKDAAKQAEEDAKKAAEAAKLADEEAQKAAEEAQTAQETANAEADKTAEQEQNVAEADKIAQELQDFADKKENEAQQDRTEIAKDQQALLDEALGAAERNTVIGLKVVNEPKDLSQMIKLSVDNGEIVRLSPVTVIHRREIIAVTDPTIMDATGKLAQASGTYYLAICGDGSNGAIKLCVLDSDSMEIQRESEEVLAENSVLTADNNGAYYCVIKDGNSWVVGKYNKSTELLLKSPVSVEPSTPITITPKGLVVTASNGSSVLLETSELKSVF